MVGHSQLESDMLEASPPPTAAAADAAADDDDDAAAADADDEENSAEVASKAEAPTAQDDTRDDTDVGDSGDDEALQGVQTSPAPQAAAQGSPMPVPQPGRKRKRSSLCRREDAAPVGLGLCNSLSSLQGFDNNGSNNNHCCRSVRGRTMLII